MSQEQAKVVELVLPKAIEPAAPTAIVVKPVPASNWWIAVVVVLVVAANAILVWWRVSGRDPVRRAFDAGARRARLDRREKRLVERLAGDRCPPVALLVSDSALCNAAAGIEEGGGEEPLVISIRRKLREVQA